MPSSGRTPSRSPEPRVLLLFAGEDHPKACTGRRLVSLGLAEVQLASPAPRPRPLLLDPHAETPLSAADRPDAERGGLLGVDCSWNALERRGGYPGLAPWLLRLTARRLPWLLAANPQHYGRLAELNTAEAVGAALLILGQPERAQVVLGTFRGGDGFLDLNRSLLDGYVRARSADDVRRTETEHF